MKPAQRERLEKRLDVLGRSMTRSRYFQILMDLDSEDRIIEKAIQTGRLQKLPFNCPTMPLAA